MELSVSDNNSMVEEPMDVVNADEVNSKTSIDGEASDSGKNGKKDANDYSRFDDISDDDDPADFTDEPKEPALPLPESLYRANSLKETGNAAFKAGNLLDAKTAYRDAIKALQPHRLLTPPAISDAEYVDLRSALVSLHGNSSMVAMKEEQWPDVIKAANEVLAIESDNIKSLYRRSVAYRRMGRLEDSKEGLQRVLQLDAANSAAKKELIEVTKELKLHHQKEKQSYNAMFSKGSIYDDRERERKAKAKREAEEQARLQDEWTKDKLKRRAEGKDELTFEEWKKEQQEEKKRVEEARKAAAAAKKPSVPKPVPAADSEEYDSDDMKIVAETKSKGYCYFKRKLPEEENALLGDIAPKAVANTPSTLPSTPEETGKVEASSWNTAGTWEERSMTTQVTEKLRQVVKTSITHGDASATVTDVKTCDGEASIVITRGKKRHIYDYHIVLALEVAINEKSYKATLELNDVTTVCHYEYKLSFKRALPAEYRITIESAANALKDEVIERLNQYADEYKSF